MLTLTEIYLMKSYKYIRREWRNGRWRYWYDDVKDKFVRGRYGQILRNFVGDPRQAFKALFRGKTGQAYDVVKIKLPAIDVDENGRPYQVYQTGGEPLLVETPIDMIWGNVDKGLKHILLRHFVQQNDFSSIQNVEDVLTYNLIRFQNILLHLKSNLMKDMGHMNCLIKEVNPLLLAWKCLRICMEIKLCGILF